MAIRLSIVIPEKNVFDGDVLQVSLPGGAGGLGVLPHHAPLLTTLRRGELRYVADAGERSLTLTGGFAEVTPTHVQVLADGIEESPA